MDCVLEYLKILNDNQQAIYSLIKESGSEEVITKLEEIESTIETNQKKLISKLNTIITNIETLSENQTSCCEQVNEKLDYVIDYINGTDIEEWQTQTQYEVDDLCCYEGLDYFCICAHTSQSDWTPDVAVTLWNRYYVEEVELCTK